MNLKMAAILILCFLNLTNCFGQPLDKYIPFKISDYAADKYQIKLDTASFFKYKVEIRQAKLLDNKNNTPSDFYCRGWLNVLQDDSIIVQQFFKSIEPVGGCSGLFIPDSQPSKDYFIFSKFGDYDGSIFIIDTTGKITEKMGGVFYVSKDKHYLFSSYDSDLSGLTVFDFSKKLILFSDTIEPYLADWYFQDKKYFAIVSEDELKDNEIKIAIYDFNQNKLTISSVDKDYPKTQNKLNAQNNYQFAKDCNCGH